MERQLPDTMIKDQSDFLCALEEETNQSIDFNGKSKGRPSGEDVIEHINNEPDMPVVQSKGRTSGEDVIEHINNEPDMPVVQVSSEDESAGEEHSGEEKEEVEDLVETSRGDRDTAVNEASCRGWYRPEQHRKCKQGKGGNKKRSRKRGARGKRHHNNKENIAEIAGETESKTMNRCQNHDTVCCQPMNAENVSTQLAAANSSRGAVRKESVMTNEATNTIQNLHTVRGQSVGRADGRLSPSVATHLDVLPSVGGLSHPSQRPAIANVATDTDDLPLADRELFRDRPRNWPRTQSARQAARLHRMIDFEIMIIFIEHMDFIRTRGYTPFWSDSDSD